MLPIAKIIENEREGLPNPLIKYNGTPVVFVFGSNLAGRHGKGAALSALRNHGAIYGQGFGPQGSSFAIPTKDENLKTLPLEQINVFIKMFIEFAKLQPTVVFYVTRIGCGLAGYKDKDIAPMFKGIPSNCRIHQNWEQYIKEEIIKEENKGENIE